MKKPTIDASKYSVPSKEERQNTLTPLQYNVTQNAHTEAPHNNEYCDTFEEGIYVDIVSGEPLFMSCDKFASGCGWPSFSKPISQEVIRYFQDNSHHMHRTEVKSRVADSHLGHVFNDGPRELGGMRYCINSAALRFIPKDKMEQEGYGDFIPLLDNHDN